MFEWYSIREYYLKEVDKTQKLLVQEAPLKLKKKLSYLNKRDTLTLFQISCAAKNKVGGL